MRASINLFRVFILPIVSILLILIGFVANTFGQGVDRAQRKLRPRVLADKYLVQADQLHEKKDFEGALKLIGKIIALEKEHDFQLRDEFHFQRAQIAYSAGFIQTAVDALHEYLAPESEGEFYKEALRLLIKAEEEMQEVEIAPDKTCAVKPVGSSCWMALADRPDCYVWNPNLQNRESVTWNGGCEGNVARGDGTLSWAVADGDSLRKEGSSIGRLRKGKFHGHWVNLFPAGGRLEGTYMDGLKHGLFVSRSSFERWKGEFSRGKEEGTWLIYSGWGGAQECESVEFVGGVERVRRNVGLEMCQW